MREGRSVKLMAFYLGLMCAALLPQILSPRSAYSPEPQQFAMHYPDTNRNPFADLRPS
jgi:hypothetical protein